MRGLLAILFFALGLISNNLIANDLDSSKVIFEEASEAYKTGEYEKALNLFLKVDSTAEGFAINYNLGNTYYKLNKLPESILYYERALKFEPTNDDASHNLKVANTLIVDRIESVPQSKLALWWREFKYSTSPSGWAWLAVMLAFLSVLFFLIFILSRKKSIKRTGFFTALALLILMGASLVLANQSLEYRNNSTHGVIFSDKVDVRSEPKPGSTQVFVLHAGTKVRLISQDGDWVNIEIASGSKGWVQLEDLKEI
jgi:tetratricopeptide (TPR) repeat protein